MKKQMILLSNILFFLYKKLKIVIYTNNFIYIMDNIIREFPKFRTLPEKPKRFSLEDFEKYEILKKESSNINNFEYYRPIQYIDKDKYLIETEFLYEIYNQQCKDIEEYNNNVKEIIKKINNLNFLNEYIEFENKKYGLSLDIQLNYDDSLSSTESYSTSSSSPSSYS